MSCNLDCFNCKLPANKCHGGGRRGYKTANIIPNFAKEAIKNSKPNYYFGSGSRKSTTCLFVKGE